MLTLRLRERLHGGAISPLVQPLVSLVELIRGKKLKVQDVPARAIAETARRYVNSESVESLDNVGELASTLSLLMLMKSRELTPWMEAVDLEELIDRSRHRQLGALESLEPGILNLHGRLESGFETVSRVDFVSGSEREEVALPISPTVLAKAFEQQILTASIRGQARVGPPIFLRVEMAIRSLQDSLRRLRAITFHGLIRDQSLDRRATVVYFLALLDLARKGLITVRQDSPFQDLVLSAEEPIPMPAAAGEFAG